MGSEFWAAIWGAIVGSALAGVISYLLQRQAFNAEEQRRLAERKEILQTLARALLYKLIRVYSNLYHLKEHLEESIARDRAAQSWTMVTPIANLPDAVFFSPEEMSVVLQLKDDNLFNQLLNLDTIHNSTLAAFATYAKQRQEMLSGIPAEIHGRMGTTAFSDEEFKVLRPKMAELDHLIEDIRLRCLKDVKESAEILKTLQAALQKHLTISHRLEFISVTEQ